MGLDDEDDELLDRYLRQVWANAVADRPYPAISERLAEKLAVYCNEMNQITIGDLAADVANGRLAWVPDELAEAIRSRSITPAIWDRLADTGLDDDDYEALDADLREVWSRVSPERPYPEPRPGRTGDPDT